MIRFIPLLHQNTILIELTHQILYQLILERQLLQQQMLRQRVHHYCLLQIVLQMIANQLQCLIISVNHSRCSSIRQRYLLLHLYLHRIQLFNRLIDDTDRVLADHHIVFPYHFCHILHLVLELIELMDKSLCLLLKSNSFKIKHFLNTLQWLDFMRFMLHSLINTRNTNYWFIIIAVQVE